jgi:lactate dehydrogenase-like 2-hydroxyacid dehydrogenase
MITARYPDELLSELGEIAELDVHPDPYSPRSREEVLSAISGVHGIINQGELKVDEELLGLAPQLRVVANASVGFDKLDTGLMNSHGVWGTNVPNVYHIPVAEYVFATLGSLLRRIRPSEDYVRRGDWDSFEPGRWDGVSLDGKTIGIVGFGKAGQRVAGIAEGFGMKVILNSRSWTGDERYRDLRRLASEADVVSLHVPLKEDTYHLIDSGFLNAMKPQAYLVNVARGPVVDQQALIQILGEKRIAGAVLDVFDGEPDVPQELRNMPNVILTPHIAGGTKEARRQAQSLAVANVKAVLAGERPHTPVNDPAQAGP